MPSREKNNKARPAQFLYGSPTCVETVKSDDLKRLKAIYDAVNEVIGLWTPLPANLSSGHRRKILNQVKSWGNEIPEAVVFSDIQTIKTLELYLTSVSETQAKIREQTTGIIKTILSSFDTDNIRTWDDLSPTIRESTEKIYERAYQLYDTSTWLNSIYELVCERDREAKKEQEQNVKLKQKGQEHARRIADLEKKIKEETAKCTAAERENALLVQQLQSSTHTKVDVHELTETVTALTSRVNELEALYGTEAEKTALLVSEIDSLRGINKELRRDKTLFTEREHRYHAELKAAYQDSGTPKNNPDNGGEGGEHDTSLALSLPSTMHDGRPIQYNDNRVLDTLRDLQPQLQTRVVRDFEKFATDPFYPSLEPAKVSSSRPRHDTKTYRVRLTVRNYRFMWREVEGVVHILSLFKKGTRAGTVRNMEELRRS